MPKRIQDELGGFTSDHAWQTIEVNDSGPSGSLTLRGFTWNLLNKGHEKGTGPYSNNPFNIQEDPIDYVQRKEKQLAEILSVIHDRANKNQPLDFLLLQEVNIFTNGELTGFPARNANPPKFPNPTAAVPPIPGLKGVVDNFKQQLNRLGYELELTNPQESGCKPMVTIYNKNTLQRSGPQKGFLDERGKNTCFELPFVHRQTQKPVAITNLHLPYGPPDRSDELLKYQCEQIQKGVLTVMGGDTNHPPNFELEGQIENFNYATNIEADPANPGALSVDDYRPGQSRPFKKHYDGFFCSPSDKGQTITATETDSICFEQKNGKVSTRTYSPAIEYPQYAKHTAPLPGLPWIRHRNAAKLLPFVKDPSARQNLTTFIVQAQKAAQVAPQGPAAQAPQAQAASQRPVPPPRVPAPQGLAAQAPQRPVAAPQAQSLPPQQAQAPQPTAPQPRVSPRAQPMLNAHPNFQAASAAANKVQPDNSSYNVSHYSALANNGEYRVGIRFSTPEAKEQFLKEFKQISTKAGINADAFVKSYADKPLVVYIEPSKGPQSQGTYKSRNGELSINFGNTQLRDFYFEKTGLKDEHGNKPSDPSLNKAFYYDPKVLPLQPDTNPDISKRKKIETEYTDAKPVRSLKK